MSHNMTGKVQTATTSHLERTINDYALLKREFAFRSVMVMRTLALPDAVEQRSLTTLREKLIKIGARARHWSVLPMVFASRATAG